MAHSALLAAATGAALFGSAPACADTIIAGGNLTTQTWTAAGSPYVVQGDVTVVAGATLTIQTGTTVVFPSGDSQAGGLSNTRTELTVRGVLTVNGAAGSPVTFRAQTGTSPATWYGIVVHDTATSATITNAVVSHAFYGVSSSAPGAALTLTDSTLQASAGGVAINAGTPTLARLTASGCTWGIILASTGAVQVVDSTVQACSASGVMISAGSPSLTRLRVFGNLRGVEAANAVLTMQNCHLYQNFGTAVVVDQAPAQSTMRNCTLDSNHHGVSRSGTGNLFLYNCIVARGTGIGLQGSINGGLGAFWSDVYGNALGNYSGAGASGGTISADPLLAAVGECRLLGGSPCIDSGFDDECVGTDLFGAVRPQDGDLVAGAHCDMGAYEAPVCSPTVITAQPQPVMVRAGRPFSLSVAATGMELTYQWRRNGVHLVNQRDVTGATAPTMMVGFAGAYDAGAYDVVVWGRCGAPTSSAAAVTVNAACAADFNGSGATSVQDIFDFLAAYFSGCP